MKHEFGILTVGTNSPAYQLLHCGKDVGAVVETAKRLAIETQCTEAVVRRAIPERPLDEDFLAIAIKGDEYVVRVVEPDGRIKECEVALPTYLAGDR